MYKMLLLGILAVSPLFADVNCSINRKCDSSWENAKTQYSPPILANGDIGTIVDYRNCQFQDIPSYKKIRCVGGNYAPSIYRAGRRIDSFSLACFGRFEERVNVGDDKNAVPRQWSQNLDILKAESNVKNVYGDGIKIDSTAFVHSDYPIVAVQKRFSNKSPKSYEFIYKLARRKSDKKPLHTYVWTNKDGLDFEVEREKAKDSFAGKVAVICDNPKAKVAVENNSIRITIDNPQGDIAFFIVLTDNFEKNDFNAQMETLKSKIASEGWTGLRMSHQKKWVDFWAKSKISIPDKRIEATYDTALYNLKCWSTKWSIPVGILPTHWEGKYFGFTFFNPALCAAGHIAEAKKVAQFRFDTLDSAFERSGRKTQGMYSGARYNWLVVENGDEGLRIWGRWVEHVLHMPNIALECQTCFEYTNDTELLKNTLYPVISACAAFFEKQMVYETKDGKTILGTCCDLERLPSALKNAFLSTAGAISTLRFATKDARILGVDKERAQVWSSLADKLEKHLPHDGEKYLPYPDAKERSVGAISGIYPYGSVSASDTLQKAAVYDFEKNGLSVGNMYKTGSRICSWYAAWLGAAQARYGDGEGALRNIRASTDSVGKFYEIFEINEPNIMSVPWCSSPQGTYIQAVNEMLLQCSGDTIKICPAIPKEWKDLEFFLCAFDDIEVRAKISGGNVKTLSLKTGEKYSGRPKTVIFPDGSQKTFNLKNNSTQICSL